MTRHFPALLMLPNRSQELKINAWPEGKTRPPPLPSQSLYLMRPLLPEGYLGFGRHWNPLRLRWARPRGQEARIPRDAPPQLPRRDCSVFVRHPHTLV